MACVIGYPVAHSQSPIMHNAAFRELALDWIYVPFGVAPDDLPAALSGLYALGVRGVNVTIPHKEAVMQLVTSISAEAAAIGSVNTLLRTAAGWHGHSTDGEGFMRGLLEHNVSVTGKRTVIMGAGGAARAVVGALAQAGAGEITIIARHPERAHELQLLGQQNNCPTRVIAWDAGAQAAVAQAELLVNATSIGMTGKADGESPVSAAWIAPGSCVYDLVYNPRITPLLHAAKARNCVTIDGLMMLAAQGAASFSLWTGCEAPLKTMMEALESCL